MCLYNSICPSDIKPTFLYNFNAASLLISQFKLHLTCVFDSSNDVNNFVAMPLPLYAANVAIVSI